MLPNKLDLAWSTLSAIKEGKHRRSEIVEKVYLEIARELEFGRIPGRMSIYDKMSSVFTLLKHEGLVTNESKRGVWSITASGELVLFEGKHSKALLFLYEPGIYTFKELQEQSQTKAKPTDMVVIRIDVSKQTIRYEKDLQEIIASKLKYIVVDGEPLTLYKSKDGKSPVEYRTWDGHRIDILATKKVSGDLVCVELKLNDGTDSQVGRLQAYMGRVMEKFPTKEVTGVLLARRITSSAKYSALVSGKKIVLLEYEFIEEQNHSRLEIKQINNPCPSH